MTDLESGARAPTPAVLLPLWPTTITWRYRGDRAAADAAYAARFHVTTPPEPSMLPDGTWAYPLPGQNA